MAVQLQLVRGTDAVLNAYTGAAGEILISTTDNRPRVYSGVAISGDPLAFKSEVDTATANAATADNKAVTADGKAVTALANAATADGKAVTALANAVTADGKAVTALANAATADGKAVTADGKATTALANAATADGKAVTADGKAVTADGKAVTALANAATADGKAVTALANAATADGKATTALANAATNTTALLTTGRMLSSYGAPKSIVAVAGTYTSVTQADNGGNTQLSSAGVHGLTTSPAVGAYIGVNWSTGPVSAYKVLSVDSTLLVTIDLPYTPGYGTPTVASTGTAIYLQTVTIPANAMGANGVITFNTSVSTSSGTSGNFKVIWEGYVDDNIISPSSTLTPAWSLRNQNNTSANTYNYRENFVKDTLTVDTTVSSVVNLNVSADTANNRVTLNYHSAMLWPSS